MALPSMSKLFLLSAHSLSAYFLAVNSYKRMRLTTSIYGTFCFLDTGVGNITYTFSTDAEQLHKFFESVEVIQASGGGDGPEYALYAMLEALKLKDGRYPLMVDGSQIMVLTDAPTKQPELEPGVIKIATEQRVCIHFFTSGGGTLADGIFERIANQTHGNIVS